MASPNDLYRTENFSGSMPSLMECQRDEERLNMSLIDPSALSWAPIGEQRNTLKGGLLYGPNVCPRSTSF